MRVGGEPAWGDRGARRVLSLQLGTGGAFAPRGPIRCCVHTLELARIELHGGWGGEGAEKTGRGALQRRGKGWSVPVGGRGRGGFWTP